MLQVLKAQLGESMKSVRHFLEKPIKLDDGNLKLGVSKATLREQQREANRKRVRHMKRDLYELFGQHPSSRQLMRHLAVVERTLRAEGLEGFQALPVRVVAKALAEMENLVRDWSPVGLAELRSRMAVMVKDQSAQLAKGEFEEREAFVMMQLPQAASADVTEVDHSEFEEMERSWVGVIPSPSAANEPQAAQQASA